MTRVSYLLLSGSRSVPGIVMSHMNIPRTCHPRFSSEVTSYTSAREFRFLELVVASPQAGYLMNQPKTVPLDSL